MLRGFFRMFVEPPTVSAIAEELEKGAMISFAAPLLLPPP